MQQPLIPFPGAPRLSRLLRSSMLVLLAVSSGGCYMFSRKNKGGVSGRVLAAEAKKLVPAPPAPIVFPSSLLGSPMGAALSASERAISGTAGKFDAACATYHAVHCEGRWYGPYLLQVAVLPAPSGAVGVMGALAFAIEREGKKEQEFSAGPDFAITRWGHRVALVTGAPLANAKPDVFKSLQKNLAGVVKPGGPDAGLEFLERWRRLGIDRSKVLYEPGGYWGRSELAAFHTPIDAGELFYFDSDKPAEVIAQTMAVDQFTVVRSKRLIFAGTKMGEVQIVFSSGWVQGVSSVEDPARAGLFLDSVLYDTVKRSGSTMNYDNPDSDLVPSNNYKKY